MLDQINNLAFGDTANLIEMKAALLFLLFGIQRRAEKRIDNHGDGGDGRPGHSEDKFPIGEQSFQGSNSKCESWLANLARRLRYCAALDGLLRPAMPHKCVF